MSNSKESKSNPHLNRLRPNERLLQARRDYFDKSRNTSLTHDSSKDEYSLMGVLLDENKRKHFRSRLKKTNSRDLSRDTADILTFRSTTSPNILGVLHEYCLTKDSSPRSQNSQRSLIPINKGYKFSDLSPKALFFRDLDKGIVSEQLPMTMASILSDISASLMMLESVGKLKSKAERKTAYKHLHFKYVGSKTNKSQLIRKLKINITGKN